MYHFVKMCLSTGGGDIYLAQVDVKWRNHAPVLLSSVYCKC